MHDYITRAERLDFTTNGTRPYRGPCLEVQQARMDAERQRAIAYLGTRWLLHPVHAPARRDGAR